LCSDRDHWHVLANMDRQSNGKVTPTDRSIAVHEAAHAVAAVRLGLPLVYTSIQGGGAGD